MWLGRGREWLPNRQRISAARTVHAGCHSVLLGFLYHGERSFGSGTYVSSFYGLGKKIMGRIRVDSITQLVPWIAHDKA